MVEPISTAAVAAYAVKKASGALARVLGPASEELAEGLRQFTALKVQNALRVVEAADRKKNSSEAGSVPSRVALRILEEGSYSDDDVVVEYLGGVLASSRSPKGRDDRGNTYTAMVSRLSSYHLRTHYIIYSELARCVRGESFNVYMVGDLQEHATIALPFSGYFAAMEFESTEDHENIMASAMYQLDRERLINFRAAGDREHLKPYINSDRGAAIKYAPEDGIVAGATIAGIELFMWAIGMGRQPASDFLLLDPEDYALEGIKIPPCAIRTDLLPSSGTREALGPMHRQH